METALQKRKGSSSRRSPLTPNVLRYILQCPFQNNDTVNELHKNELIDLTQLLLQNLALIPCKNYHKQDPFMIHVIEFERSITRQITLREEERPNLSSLDRQSKKWIYSVLYEEITNHQNPKPVYILKAFSTTVNIIYHSSSSDESLADDLKYILQFLIALQKYANKLDQSPSQISYGCLIHTWILSLLFLLARCFTHNKTDKQELLSRLKDVKQQRQQSHQMWSHFLITEFGLIETSQSAKDKLTMQKSLRDESIRVPYEAIFGANSTDGFVSSLDLPGMSVSPKANTHKDDRLPSPQENTPLMDDIDDIKDEEEEDVMATPTPEATTTRNETDSPFMVKRHDRTNSSMVDIVTHLIPFDKLLPIIARCVGIDTEDQESWIKEASKRYNSEPDYQDLFKSPQNFRPGFNDNASNLSDSAGLDYAPSITLENWDQGSIPSELYFGMDVFQTPTTGKGHSLKNLFDEDDNLKQRLRKNILTKKRMEKMIDFFDVIDVYNAQTDHGENANDLFFSNLQHKLTAELETEQLLNGTYHLIHGKEKKGLFDNRDKNKDKNDYDKDDDDINHIVGIDEDQDLDYKDGDIQNKYINKSSFKTSIPTLLKLSYKSQTDLTTSLLPGQRSPSPPHQNKGEYRRRGDTNPYYGNNEDIAYLMIDQHLITNDDMDLQQMQDLLSSTTKPDPAYHGTSILTKDFEYRLGIEEFTFEQGYADVEYELEGLNFHYVDPNDEMNTMFNYHSHHHHSHPHHDGYNNEYESDISADSDDEDYFMGRKRGISRHHNTKKKKKKNKFGKQMGKKWKDFGKGLREMGEKMKAGRTRHGQQDSNENIQLTTTSNPNTHFRKATTEQIPVKDALEEPPSYNIRGGIRRQQSSPQPYTHRMSNAHNRDSSNNINIKSRIRDEDDIVGIGKIDIDDQINNIYLRKQMSGNQAGSLTDGDEPLSDQNNNINNIDHINMKASEIGGVHGTDKGYHSTGQVTINRSTSKAKLIKNGQKSKGMTNVPSASTTPEQRQDMGSGGINYTHHRRGSSGSQSIPSESNTFNHIGGGHPTNNPIMEEEDAEYYASDQDVQ